MIILRNKLFSSSSNEDDKLTKAEKAAGATAIAGAGVAGYGQGDANAKKKEYIKRREDWHKSHGMPEKTAKETAKFDWKHFKPYKLSRKNIRENLEEEKKFIDKIKNNKNCSQKDLYVDAYNLQKEQSKTLLSRKKGKTTAKAGAAAVAAGLGYLGYSEYKKHKKAKGNDNTKK